MDSTRKTAILVGILFIIATVMPIVSVVFIGSIYDAEYLTAVSANENQVLLGVLLLLIMTVAIVSIPILMFPILKNQNETLALGYVGSRIFEGFFSTINIINILSILSLSQEYTKVGTSNAAYYQTSGALLLAGFNWNSILLDFPFTIGALVFNYLLYKSDFIPRWLSAFGLIGGALWLLTIPLRMFKLFPPSMEILALPIATQEMILAVWLIVKGFNSSKENAV
jgi:hypothetical protein